MNDNERGAAVQSTENKTEPRLGLDVLHYAITAHIQKLSEGNDARSDEPLVLTLQAASDALAAERDRADRAEAALVQPPTPERYFERGPTLDPIGEKVLIERTARAMFELGGTEDGDWTWADVVREEPSRTEVWRDDAREVVRAMLDAEAMS